MGYDDGWRIENHPRFAADVTGDGAADLVGFGDDGVWVSVTGNGGARSSWTDSVTTRAGGSRCIPATSRT